MSATTMNNYLLKALVRELAKSDAKAQTGERDLSEARLADRLSDFIAKVKKEGIK